MLQGSNLLKKLPFSAVITFSVVILDYISKQTILDRIMPHEAVDVLPFLRIVNVQNEGAAFGLFTSLGNNFFIIISFVAIILIVIYISRIKGRLELFSISLILGGAVGNLIDRLTVGKVVDFIDFFVGKWHWPAFNVADSALTVGIILFLIDSLRNVRSTVNGE